MAPEVALAELPEAEAGVDSFAAMRARVKARDRATRIPRSSELGQKIRANRPSAAENAMYDQVKADDRSARRRPQSGGAFRPSKVARSVSLPRIASGGDIVMRLVVALGVAIVALEVASYVSGRYFTWDVKSGATKVQNAGTYLGLYPGQKDKLHAAAAAAASPAAAPAPAVASYAGHGSFV